MARSGGGSRSGSDESVMLVYVGDREADIFDLFGQPRQVNSLIADSCRAQSQSAA